MSVRAAERDAVQPRRSTSDTGPLFAVLRLLLQWAMLTALQFPNEVVWRSAVFAVAAVVFSATAFVLTTPWAHTVLRRRSTRWLVYCEVFVLIFVVLAAAGESRSDFAGLLFAPTTFLAWRELESNRSSVAVTLILVALTGGMAVSRLRMDAIDAPVVFWPEAWLYGATVLLLIAVSAWGREWRWRVLTQQEADAAAGIVARQEALLMRSREQLSAYAEEVYHLAAAEERNRIAGEIHDTVAHRLTALIVQLQVARRISESGEPAVVADNLRLCESLAREALEEVRMAVRAMRRHTAGEGVEALRRLTLEYGRLTGTEVEFQSDVDRLPPRLMGVLQRAVQESLTNANRHGRATRVRVHLTRVGADLRLEVTDNGRGASHPQFGIGLLTMSDRVRALGGDVVVRTEPGRGFAVRVSVPALEANEG